MQPYLRKFDRKNTLLKFARTNWITIIIGKSFDKYKMKISINSKACTRVVEFELMNVRASNILFLFI